MTLSKSIQESCWINYRDEKQKAKIEAAKEMISAFNKFSEVDNQFERDTWDQLKFYVNTSDKGFVLDYQSATRI